MRPIDLEVVAQHEEVRKGLKRDGVGDLVKLDVELLEERQQQLTLVRLVDPLVERQGVGHQRECSLEEFQTWSKVGVGLAEFHPQSLLLGGNVV